MLIPIFRLFLCCSFHFQTWGFLQDTSWWRASMAQPSRAFPLARRASGAQVSGTPEANAAKELLWLQCQVSGH